MHRVSPDQLPADINAAQKCLVSGAFPICAQKLFREQLLHFCRSGGESLDPGRNKAQNPLYVIERFCFSVWQKQPARDRIEPFAEIIKKLGNLAWFAFLVAGCSTQAMYRCMSFVLRLAIAPSVPAKRRSSLVASIQGALLIRARRFWNRGASPLSPSFCFAKQPRRFSDASAAAVIP